MPAKSPKALGWLFKTTTCEWIDQFLKKGKHHFYPDIKYGLENRTGEENLVLTLFGNQTAVQNITNLRYLLTNLMRRKFFPKL
jgi:hypothetical protein